MDDKLFRNIQKEVLDEIQNEMTHLLEDENTFKTKLTNFQDNLNTHLRKSCKNEVEWVERYTKLVNGLPQHSPDDKEVNNKLHELQVCLDRNSSKQKEFLSTLNSESIHIDNLHVQGINKCSELDNQQDVKNCLKSEILKHGNRMKTFLIDNIQALDKMKKYI